MRSRHKLVVVVGIVFGLVAFMAGITVAASGAVGDGTAPAAVSDEPTDEEGAADKDESSGTDESDGALSGDIATKAADAALAATGGGTVLAVESDDANAGYEVEIRKSDGSEVEVELDTSFEVVQRAEDD